MKVLAIGGSGGMGAITGIPVSLRVKDANRGKDNQKRCFGS
jgi:hypothetical protein